MARGTAVAQFGPYMGDGLQVLVGVAGGDGDDLGSPETEERGYPRPADLQRILVGEDENLVVLAFGDGNG